MGMVIDDKYLFIHNPKCGGSFIRRYFTKRANTSWLEKTKEWFNEKGVVTRYISANGVEDFNNKFKLSFCRDPYDRAISAYKYLCKSYNKTFDLDSFIDGSILLENQDEINHSIPEKNLFYKGYMWHYLISQTQHLSYNSKLIKLDFLGRFENLPEEFKKIHKIIGSSENIDYHKKYNESNNEVINLSDRNRNYIYKLFYEDFYNFGYSQ